MNLESGRQKNKSGYIDKSGRMVIRPLFDDACDFHEGLACVEIAGKMGYIDKTGRIAIALQFDDADDFSEGLAKVVDWQYGFIDKQGKILIEPQFAWAGQFSGGLAQVMVEEKKGYIDRAGNYVWRPSK